MKHKKKNEINNEKALDCFLFCQRHLFFIKKSKCCISSFSLSLLFSGSLPPSLYLSLFLYLPPFISLCFSISLPSSLSVSLPPSLYLSLFLYLPPFISLCFSTSLPSSLSVSLPTSLHLSLFLYLPRFISPCFSTSLPPSVSLTLYLSPSPLLPSVEYCCKVLDLKNVISLETVIKKDCQM